MTHSHHTFSALSPHSTEMQKNAQTDIFLRKKMSDFALFCANQVFGETNGIVSVPLYAAWALDALMRARSASRV
ncbi:hypothetical protein EHS19_02930 [Bifidobacterium jacchi]|uniref:Uncharacterized protein n=1 Tax=Bifidobacterium jacchi TaxID=2490545 RepID=A0A5N5RKT3_9BIFI|nr:hypothetical protein EHS19_02930 [Bifidobacterium jacchi]